MTRGDSHVYTVYVYSRSLHTPYRANRRCVFTTPTPDRPPCRMCGTSRDLTLLSTSSSTGAQTVLYSAQPWIPMAYLLALLPPQL